MRAAHIVAEAIRCAHVSWGTVSLKAGGPTGRNVRCRILDLTQHQSTLVCRFAIRSAAGYIYRLVKIILRGCDPGSWAALTAASFYPSRPGRLRFAAMGDQKAVIGCLLLAYDFRGNTYSPQLVGQRDGIGARALLWGLLIVLNWIRNRIDE